MTRNEKLKNREYRNFIVPFEIRALEDENRMVVEGYATTFNEP